MKERDRVQDARSRLAREIERAAPDRDRPYALLDFPNHGNPGDAAIWLGERRILEELHGAPPAYTGGVRNLSFEGLGRRVGDGVIYLHGGGNFGDLWEGFQLFRERVIRSMPDNPIVMLSQTLHFESRAALDRARSVIDDHGAVRVLLRDEESLEIARREFSSRVRLCPDGAFGLGKLQRSRQPSVDIMCLLRRDKERKTHEFSTGTVMSSLVTDWIQSRGALVEWLDRRVRRSRDIGATPDWLLHRLSGRLGDAAAGVRLKRAVDTLSRGRVVITDRLHGHILSSMLGIPNVVLDNSYGKNRRFYNTWSRDDPTSRFCHDPSEVVPAAQKLARIVASDVSAGFD